MRLIALFLFSFIFARTFSVTSAQEKTDSKNVKKAQVTKSIDVNKTDVTKPTDVQKSTDVTKTKDVTTPIDAKTLNAIKKDVVTAGTGKPVNSVCIVSGEEFDSKISADYKGKTYAFCCKKCLAKFAKDPEKYVAKFDKQTNKSKN
jgi:YHS domain-containing protein